jgi:hypothetical protein
VQNLRTVSLSQTCQFAIEGLAYQLASSPSFIPTVTEDFDPSYFVVQQLIYHYLKKKKKKKKYNLKIEKMSYETL